MSQFSGFCSWLMFRTGCWYLLNRLAGWLSWSFELWISANDPKLQIDKSTSCNNFHGSTSLSSTCSRWRYAQRRSGTNLQRVTQFWNINFKKWNINFIFLYSVVISKWVFKWVNYTFGVIVSIWYKVMGKFALILRHILI